MENSQLWRRYQDWLYYHEQLELFLDISRIRFDDSFVEEIKPKFDQAFKELTDLEAGAIANADEDRMVGHYWLRNPELAPTPEIAADIAESINKIEKFAKEVHSGEIAPPGAEKFTDILSVGIGGSALGPQFVEQALSPDNPPLRIHFIDNSDPAGIDRIMGQLKDRLNTTMVIVTSKSGGTPETRNGMLEVKKVYANAKLDFSSHAVAVTAVGMNSKLEKVAKDEHWLGIFAMYDWIGGRTSELSAVGLLPAALQGIDIRQMLAGAKLMDDATRVADLKTNPAALLAMAWYYAGDGKGAKDMVILPYKDSLALFSRYLQQLVMESLGKQCDRDGNVVNQGIAVYGNKGSTDQHAYVQQLREGVNNFFATFIEVLSDRYGASPEIEPGITTGDFLSGFFQGTRAALYENQRDSITITIESVTPQVVGALIALYERAVSLYASLVNINAYHQPGVEAGKKAAAGILELQTSVVKAIQSSDRPLSLEEIASKINGEDKIESVYFIVRHLVANDRLFIIEGSWGEPASLTIARA
jgi:glucose-6-phosphate isomerase